MACDKIYGLRRVWIRKTGTSTWQECKVSSIEVPKVQAESLSIDESSGYRTDTVTASGSLNELTGTMTVTLPATSTGFLSRSDIEALFYAASFVKSSSKMHPINNGGCEHTCEIFCLDRTGRLGEWLTDVIVTNISLTLNRSDAPALSISYQAGRKVELWGGELTTALEEDVDTITNGNGMTIRCGMEVMDFDDHLWCQIGNDILLVSNLDGDDIKMTDGTEKEYPVGTPIYPCPPEDAVSTASGNYLSNRNWGIEDENGDELPWKITAASLSIETGMSYGEMVAGADHLTEILVGTLAVTGSFTIYVDKQYSDISGMSLSQQGQNLKIRLGVGTASYLINLSNVIVTELPDLSLAKDAPATGDVAYKVILAADDDFEDLISIG